MSAGRGIVWASWAGVGLHAVVAAGAIAVQAARGAHAVVAIALFVGGVVSMGAAMVKAALRSRTDLIGIGGLFFAAGSAPRRTAIVLQGALAADTALAVAAAAARPLTSLAFSVLVPLWPLGMVGLWCARHGTFSERP